MQICVLGPAGTNGHEVATGLVKMFQGSVAEESPFIFCDTNNAVLDMAQKLMLPGVVPIENTTGGYVGEVMRWWLSKPVRKLYIIGEVSLPVHHCLLTQPSVESFDDITSVMSHPQALEQCANMLKRLRLVTLIPNKSTANSAFEIAGLPSKQHIAVLAPKLAAQIYGLKIMLENCEDTKGNVTRFHIVAPYAMSQSGKDRTAFLFRTPTPKDAGVLVGVLMPFKDHGVSLSCIHSIPLGSPGQYAFYAEADCHVDDNRGRDIFRKVRSLTTELNILGSYPRPLE